MKRLAVITSSDTGYREEREDLNADCRSSGKPESSKGMSGIYYI